MRIGFYLDCDDAQLASLAAGAIAAARRAMPGASIWHLTIPGAPALAGVDLRFEASADGPYPRRRAMVQRSIGGEILLLDVDARLLGDVESVWASEFDFALAVVRDPFVRYTGAVMFQRRPQFWDGWIDHPIWGTTWTTRSMLAAWTDYVDAWPGPVLRLPERVYERLPGGPDDALEGARIAHYRGPRKRWLL